MIDGWGAGKDKIQMAVGRDGGFSTRASMASLGGFVVVVRGAFWSHGWGRDG